jgi:hypothetical protein
MACHIFSYIVLTRTNIMDYEVQRNGAKRLCVTIYFKDVLLAAQIIYRLMTGCI